MITKWLAIISNFLLGYMFVLGAWNTWPDWKVVFPISFAILSAINCIWIRKYVPPQGS